MLFRSDNSKPDQLKQLSNLFLDYEAFYGTAYDVLRDGENQREQFGNIIL